jgi:prolipoprotein diacylglyceryltransferase
VSGSVQEDIAARAGSVDGCATFVAVSAWLLIPWFRPEPWTVALPCEWGDFVVYPYGLLLWLGHVVTILVALRFAATHERSTWALCSLLTYVFLFVVPCAALANALVERPAETLELLREPSRFWEFRFGRSVVGALGGAIIGALVWKRGHDGSLLRMGDAFAFGLPFGWALVALGCFLSHDHPGVRSDFFLAVADYQTGQPPYSSRHDLGLYEMLHLLTIAGILSGLSRKPRPDGYFVALFVLLYSPVRFLLDFLRAPISEGGEIRYFGFTAAQLFLILLFAIGVKLMHRVPFDSDRRLRPSGPS